MAVINSNTGSALPGIAIPDNMTGRTDQSHSFNPVSHTHAESIQEL